MNPPTWSIIILPLIVVSGAIAYAGDVIGKTLGKKRLSLLGLRPKQTAHLFSIGSGVTILLVTLTLILGFSGEARKALFQLREIEEKIPKLAREATSWKTKVDKHRGINKSLEKEGQKKQLQLTQLQASLDETEKDLAKAATDLEAKKKELDKTQQDKSLAELDRDKIGKDRLDLEKKRLALKQQVADKEAEVRQLEASAQELRLFVGDVLKTPNPVVYSINQIIASTAMDASMLGAAEIRRDLAKLLDDAARGAARLGAAGKDGGRAVILDPTPDLENRVRDENQQIDDQVNAIARLVRDAADTNDGRVIVDLVATRNCLRRNQARAVFAAYPNERVYRHGDEIAQMTVEPGLGLSAIFGRLQQLLDQGKHAAEERRLRPRGDEVYDPSTRERVLQCLDKLKQSKTSMIVKLIADRDTRSADLLRVRLEARPAPNAGE